MVLEAVEAALADAALDHGAIDSVVTCSVDLYDGLTASNLAITEVVGAVMKPETRIAGDGLCAAIHAACQLLAGAYKTTLVVAHGKASMASHPGLTAWAMDPLLLQPLGVDLRVCAALQARAVAADDPGAPRRWAEIAARRRTAASSGEPSIAALTAEQVLASAPIATPLLQDMEAPPADGACAVVLQVAETDLAGTGRASPRLTGLGYDLSTHDPGSRDLSRWAGLNRACERAYRGAGVADPEAAFDLLEPSCRYPHEEALFRGGSGAGSEHLSPSGGLFGGDVPAAAGLGRLIAATHHLRRRGGRALVHGAWGPAGQGQAVVVMEAPR